MPLIALILIAIQPAPAASAQSIQVGVVWEAPESSLLAVGELEAMRAAGVRHVRTGPIADPAVLTMADSLGIVLYRELPIVRLGAAELVDTTAYAQHMLTELLAAGEGHPSAGPIGLSVLGDTSDPDACSYFERLATGPPAQAFYYVSAFVEDDVCGGAVDFVLIEALDDREPLTMVARWEASHDSGAGLSAVGWWVDPAARRGLGSRHSPEEQARALEETLGAASARFGSFPIFVHRWRDSGRSNATPAGSSEPFGRRYGLHDVAGDERPAFAVLRSFLTTGRDVFAFASARPRRFVFPWFQLLGWSLIVTVAILYASSPRFRFMLPRYFVAHGFFRNAVREAREVLPIVSTALLTVMGVAVGQIGTQVFLTIHDTDPASHLVAVVPGQVRSIAIAIADGPVLGVVLIGCLALLGTALWMGLWMIVASRKTPLLPSQALMLGVWPRWQLLLLLPVAMSIHTLESTQARVGIAVLAVLWLGTAFWSTIRTAYDLYKLTECRRSVAVGMWLLNPVLLGLIAVLALGIVYSDQAAYIWHLAVRS